MSVSYSRGGELLHRLAASPFWPDLGKFAKSVSFANYRGGYMKWARERLRIRMINTALRQRDWGYLPEAMETMIRLTKQVVKETHDG